MPSPQPLADTADAHAPQDDHSLQAWEQLARCAQMLAEQGDQDKALAVQIQALHLASRLLAGPALQAHPNHCMAAWVVSHHNLAELLEQRQQWRLALDHLCDAHVGLTQLASAPTSPCAVQQAALRHLRETHAALLQWQGRHGGAATCIATAQPAPAAPHFLSSHLH